MSLFSSIQMAGNALRANEIALQVAGQNIANANTPGYLREEIQLKPGPTQQLGSLLLGTGVQVEAITQVMDRFLQLRLQAAISDKAGFDTLKQTYSQLESILGALESASLNDSMTAFFNGISQIMNQPEDASVRNQAVQQGLSLAQNINGMSRRVESLRKDLNDQVLSMSDNINTLVEDIRALNVRISETEGGSVSKSDAVGLRDRRTNALESLAQLINIQAIEQSDGTISVYSGGSYLVFGGTARKVGVVLDSNRGLSVADIHLLETDASLDTNSGQLHGLLTSRDEVLGGFLDQLNAFAGTLAYEFNKVYSGGQGLKGFTSLTSTFTVLDAVKPLNDAGLNFTPQNGAFQVLVRNKLTGLTEATDVTVNLGMPGRETALIDIVNQLNAISGVHAEITIDKRLKIAQASKDDEIAFADDTSGLLAALGLNTFFTGSAAGDLGVNAMLQNDPTLFAASSGGIGHDTDNARDLAVFIDRPLSAANGASLAIVYDRMIGNAAQGSNQAQAAASGADTYEATLRGQKSSISGVNLDEEAINMIQYQQAYQAAAKYIATLADLLELLVKL
ncbi:MAG: flagellar hook-associated protein FlgK [Pirellulales bacterium]|nr:flagellar hook-associated protein FlgK [Pirellulales bacterium]